MEELSTHLRVQIGRDYDRSQVRDRIAALEKLFALQHGEGGFGKRVLLKGAAVEIEMQRSDVALVTLPVTVALRDEALQEFLEAIGVTRD